MLTFAYVSAFRECFLSRDALRLPAKLKERADKLVKA